MRHTMSVQDKVYGFVTKKMESSLQSLKELRLVYCARYIIRKLNDSPRKNNLYYGADVYNSYDGSTVIRCADPESECSRNTIIIKIARRKHSILLTTTWSSVSTFDKTVLSCFTYTTRLSNNISLFETVNFLKRFIRKVKREY